MRDYVLLYVNGERYCLRGKEVFLCLADFLHSYGGMTGTKVACGEGACGSCTVLLGDANSRYRAVNACLLRVYQADCHSVVTVEGLSSGGMDALSPIQTALVECNAAQCGYCTPGIVVSLSRLFHDSAKDGKFPEPSVVREALTGNLCRCTGYLPILQAAARVQDTLPLPSLAPEAVHDLAAHSSIPVMLTAEGRQLLQPTNLADAIQFYAANPDVKIIAGGTDSVVEEATVLHIAGVPELSRIEQRGETLHIGATVAWDALAVTTADTFPELARYLQRFGSPQIRSMGTLAGSIVSAAPNADILPLLLVQEALLVLLGPEGERVLPIAAFLARPRHERFLPGELIGEVRLPLPTSGELLRLYKVTRRQAFDRAVFCAAVMIRRNRDGSIAEARVACGGAGPVAIRLPACETALRGATFSSEGLQRAGEVAVAEILPVDDAYADATYRRQLTTNLLLRFYHDVMGAETSA